jgi:hypothetical protein
MDINNIFRVDSHDKFPISIDNLRNYILWFKKFAPKNIRNPYRYFQQNNEHLPIHNPINHFIENPNMIILENYINEENWEKAYTFIHDNNNFLKEENLSIKLNEVRNFMGFDAEFNMQGLITLFYYFFNSLLRYSNKDEIINFPYIRNGNNFIESSTFIRADIENTARIFFGEEDFPIIQMFLHDNFHNETNFYQMFSNNHINMSLYYIFLMFFHRILYWTYNKNNYLQVNPYTLWLNPYLTFIQNLNVNLYKKIICDTYRNGHNQKEKRSYFSISIPKEMGNLLYWALEFNEGIPIFIENTENQNMNLFDENWKINDYYGLENEIRCSNLNLSTVLVRFINIILQWTTNNLLVSVNYNQPSIQIIFSFFSSFKLNQNDFNDPFFN